MARQRHHKDRYRHWAAGLVAVVAIVNLAAALYLLVLGVHDALELRGEELSLRLARTVAALPRGPELEAVLRDVLHEDDVSAVRLLDGERRPVAAAGAETVPPWSRPFLAPVIPRARAPGSADPLHDIAWVELRLSPGPHLLRRAREAWPPLLGLLLVPVLAWLVLRRRTAPAPQPAARPDGDMALVTRPAPPPQVPRRGGRERELRHRTPDRGRQRLLEANRAHARLLALLGSELRRLGSEAAQSPGTPEGQPRRALLSLAEDLVELSSEADRDSRALDVVALAEEAQRQIAAEASARGRRITLEPAEDLPRELYGDPTAIARVLKYLLLCLLRRTDDPLVQLAFEHLREGRREYLRLAAEGLCTPRRAGSGPPPEQARASAFALAMAREFSAALGGSVELVTRPDGRISCWADIPIATCQEKAPPAAAEGALAGRRVLVVDDNLINRKLLASLIGRNGGEAEAAANGREALERLEEGRYDGVLMDLHMPVVDGATAVAQIKRRWPQLLCIAVTAESEAADPERYRRLGFDACMLKPVSEQALIDALGSPRADEPRPAPDAQSLAPVFDRDEALRLAGGNLELAAELHGMLLKDLPDRRRQFLDESIPDLELAELTHSLHGATRYCGTPRLRLRTQQFEDVLRGRTRAMSVEDAREAVLQAVEELIALGDPFHQASSPSSRT